MEILHITLTSLGSVVALFLLTKLIGNRQMSQMSLFDYINGITIGSIAAEMATSLEDDFLKPLTAMVIYALIAVCISLCTCRSMALRKFFNGKPLVLFEHGKLYKKNLFSAKMDINEFLTQCRGAGYFDLSQLEAAVLETNGQVSFLPLSEQRPVTPHDLGVTPPPETLTVNVILDGKVLEENLKYTGRDQKWLMTQLHAQDIGQIKDVFLATVDAQGQLAAYRILDKKVSHEIFE
ncbi:DUF421 domain-containing protein [Anaerofilum sp. BX8]|uniref:DUF421 domain-containing protein n=1 Tax=Anaerofilum hominis TaxID=2763016 RepID=A0A923IDD2_9FIRM|nr:DUF421 domain-containing protein [Anaerofilum hominis]